MTRVSLSGRCCRGECNRLSIAVTELIYWLTNVRSSNENHILRSNTSLEMLVMVGIESEMTGS